MSAETRGLLVFPQSWCPDDSVSVIIRRNLETGSPYLVDENDNYIMSLPSDIIAGDTVQGHDPLTHRPFNLDIP